MITLIFLSLRNPLFIKLTSKTPHTLLSRSFCNLCEQLLTTIVYKQILAIEKALCVQRSRDSTKTKRYVVYGDIYCTVIRQALASCSVSVFVRVFKVTRSLIRSTLGDDDGHQFQRCLCGFKSLNYAYLLLAFNRRSERREHNFSGFIMKIDYDSRSQSHRIVSRGRVLGSIFPV